MSTRHSIDVDHKIRSLLRIFQVMDYGFFQTYPLWLLASKDAGGLQWPVPRIGKVRWLRACLHRWGREDTLNFCPEMSF